MRTTPHTTEHRHGTFPDMRACRCSHRDGRLVFDGVYPPRGARVRAAHAGEMEIPLPDGTLMRCPTPDHTDHMIRIETREHRRSYFHLWYPADGGHGGMFPAGGTPQAARETLPEPCRGCPHGETRHGPPGALPRGAQTERV